MNLIKVTKQQNKVIFIFINKSFRFSQIIKLVYLQQPHIQSVIKKQKLVLYRTMQQQSNPSSSKISHDFNASSRLILQNILKSQNDNSQPSYYVPNSQPSHYVPQSRLQNQKYEEQQQKRSKKQIKVFDVESYRKKFQSASSIGSNRSNRRNFNKDQSRVSNNQQQQSINQQETENQYAELIIKKESHLKELENFLLKEFEQITENKEKHQKIKQKLSQIITSIKQTKESFKNQQGYIKNQISTIKTSLNSMFSNEVLNLLTQFQNQKQFYINQNILLKQQINNKQLQIKQKDNKINQLISHNQSYAIQNDQKQQKIQLLQQYINQQEIRQAQKNEQLMLDQAFNQQNSGEDHNDGRINLQLPSSNQEQNCNKKKNQQVHIQLRQHSLELSFGGEKRQKEKDLIKTIFQMQKSYKLLNQIHDKKIKIQSDNQQIQKGSIKEKNRNNNFYLIDEQSKSNSEEYEIQRSSSFTTNGQQSSAINKLQIFSELQYTEKGNKSPRNIYKNNHLVRNSQKYEYRHIEQSEINYENSQDGAVSEIFSKKQNQMPSFRKNKINRSMNQKFQQRNITQKKPIPNTTKNQKQQEIQFVPNNELILINNNQKGFKSQKNKQKSKQQGNQKNSVQRNQKILNSSVKNKSNLNQDDLTDLKHITSVVDSLQSPKTNRQASASKRKYNYCKLYEQQEIKQIGKMNEIIQKHKKSQYPSKDVIPKSEISTLNNKIYQKKTYYIPQINNINSIDQNDPIRQLSTERKRNRARNYDSPDKIIEYVQNQLKINKNVQYLTPTRKDHSPYQHRRSMNKNHTEEGYSSKLMSSKQKGHKNLQIQIPYSPPKRHQLPQNQVYGSYKHQVALSSSNPYYKLQNHIHQLSYNQFSPTKSNLNTGSSGILKKDISYSKYENKEWVNKGKQLYNEKNRQIVNTINQNNKSSDQAIDRKKQIKQKIQMIKKKNQQKIQNQEKQEKQQPANNQNKYQYIGPEQTYNYDDSKVSNQNNVSKMQLSRNTINKSKVKNTENSIVRSYSRQNINSRKYQNKQNGYVSPIKNSNVSHKKSFYQEGNQQPNDIYSQLNPDSNVLKQRKQSDLNKSQTKLTVVSKNKQISPIKKNQILSAYKNGSRDSQNLQNKHKDRGDYERDNEKRKIPNQSKGYIVDYNLNNDNYKRKSQYNGQNIHLHPYVQKDNNSSMKYTNQPQIQNRRQRTSQLNYMNRPSYNKMEYQGKYIKRF